MGPRDRPPAARTVDEYGEWHAAALDRGRISRRHLLVGAGAAAAALVSNPLVRAVFAAGGGTAGRHRLVLAGRHLAWVFDALFSRWQVDLAVQGHNHVMERTDPIRAGRPTRAAPDGSVLEPARDGVTYLCIGSGGRARYSFPPGAGDRYRGVPGHPGPVDSYVWVADGTRAPETVGWSRVRYDGYAFLAVDVVPARVGRPTTMTLRTLADALPGRPGSYAEIDRVTLRRVAGGARIS